MNEAYKVTISEAMGWMKTLRERHAELVALRNENSKKETRFYGQNVDKERIVEPVYDVKHLDAMVTTVAREIRKLDEGIKKTNAVVFVEGYEKNEAVLGELK